MQDRSDAVAVCVCVPSSGGGVGGGGGQTSCVALRARQLDKRECVCVCVCVCERREAGEMHLAGAPWAPHSLQAPSSPAAHLSCSLQAPSANLCAMSTHKHPQPHKQMQIDTYSVTYSFFPLHFVSK